MMSSVKCSNPLYHGQYNNGYTEELIRKRESKDTNGVFKLKCRKKNLQFHNKKNRNNGEKTTTVHMRPHSKMTTEQPKPHQKYGSQMLWRFI